MDNSVLIDAENVGLSFRCYGDRTDSLKETVINLFHRKVKKKEFRCLDGITFRIRRGESVAILGRNGAGKSTLLRILAGTLTPDTGRVKVNGVLTPLLQLGAGFDRNATGIENIYLNGAILGYTKKEIDEKFNDIVEFAELGDFIHEPVRNYSSGMQARLGFSIAMNMDTDALLVDEILAVGDGAFRTKCNRKFEDLKNKGGTLVMVTHVASIHTMCERAIWIRDGKIEEDGAAKDVCKKYSDYLARLSGK